MFTVFKRSWHLTKLSFRVLLQDKEMLLFPLLGGLFSILYTAALLYPTIISDIVQGADASQLTVIEYVLLFLVYFGLAFIATFFNVCVVYTTRTRFSGGDATFMDSIKFALSRIGKILAWSAVSATVGLILHAIDRAARRAGGVGATVLHVLRSVLGLAWSVITVFVVPVMVYENLGPFASIKRSVEALKKTWGESLIRHYGLGLMQGIVLFVGILVGVGLILLLGQAGGVGLVIGIAFLVVSSTNTRRRARHRALSRATTSAASSGTRPERRVRSI